MVLSEHEIKHAKLLWKAAQLYVKKGYAILACHSTGEKAKRPISKGWRKYTVQESLQYFKEELEKNASINIGIITGKVSGLFVVDIDVKNDGMEYYAQLAEENEVPDTPHAKSGGDGRHEYFLYNDRVKHVSNKAEVVTDQHGKKVGIDVRTEGGYIIAWPSIHNVSGKMYEWLDKSIDLPLAEVPEWLLSRIQKSPSKEEERKVCTSFPKKRDSSLSGNLKDVIDLLSIERATNRDTWIDVGFALRSGGEKNRELWHYFSKKCPDKYNEGECENEWDNNLGDENNVKKIGSLYYWAKEDSPTEYYKVCNHPKKILDELCSTFTPFDKSDDYYWADFCKEFHGTKYSTRFDMERVVVPNLLRVFATVESGSLKKVVKSNTNLLFDVQSVFKTNFYISYMDKDGKKVVMGIDDFDKNYKKIFAYNGVINLPYKEGEKVRELPRGFLNIFPGFKGVLLDTPKEGIILPVLNHIKQVWANNDEEIYRYILSWFAHIIQKPDVKTKVAIVLKSTKQQVGKGIIIEFFINWVFGRQLCLKTNDMEHIAGRFNSHSVNKLFTNLDEANSNKKSKEMSEKMKGRITEASSIEEGKCEKAKDMIDYNNYIITTNHSDSVNVEQYDARYAMFECSNIYANNTKYFDELYTKIFNKECGDNLYTYLYHYDMVELRNIPSTELRNDAKMNSLAKPLLFLKEIKEGDIEFNEEFIEKKYIGKEKLFDIYKSWCMKNNIDGGSMDKFTKIIKGNISDKRISINQHRNIYYDIESVSI